MIELKTSGLQEAIDYLAGVRKRAEASATYQPSLLEIARLGYEHARAISPVVTGSYKDAHLISIGDKNVSLSISPAARNIASGVPVTDYAGAVERRHQVYSRTGVYLIGVLDGPTDKIARRIVG